MEDEQIKEKIIDIIKKYPIAALATVEGDEPRARYISIETDEDLNLVAFTFTQSRKVAQIKDNKNVYLLFGADPREEKNPCVNIEATAEICLDMDARRQFWQEAFGDYFSGPEDPNYAIIRISPRRIEYYGSYEKEPDIYCPEG